MPLADRVGFVGLRLQTWKPGSVPNFLTCFAACWEKHANDRTGGEDAATALAVEEEALAAASTVQVTDFAIPSPRKTSDNSAGTGKCLKRLRKPEETTSLPTLNCNRNGKRFNSTTQLMAPRNCVLT